MFMSRCVCPIFGVYCFRKRDELDYERQQREHMEYYIAQLMEQVRDGTLTVENSGGQKDAEDEASDGEDAGAGHEEGGDTPPQDDGATDGHGDSL
jgi:hypothetical protein